MSTKSKSIPIFIVCGKSPIASYGGGYSTYALNLAKILNSLGYKVSILSIGKENNKEQLKFGTLLTFKSFFFNYRTTVLPSLPLASLVFSNGIENLVKENNVKKFVVWGIGPWGLTGSILKKKFKNQVLFLDNYFTTLKHEWKGGLKAIYSNDYGILLKIKFFIIYYTIVQFLSFFEKRVLESADVVITNYKSTEQILMNQFHVEQKRIRRITFLTNIYSRKASDKKEEENYNLPKKYILYLSRHDPRKGINYLLHAIKILKQRNRLKIPVIIAGRGELWKANKKLAEKLKISKDVKFIGFVNNPKPLLKNATIFCFPTIEEGAGALIINEAMSLGVPIVTTYCDGIPEDIENDRSGMLVMPGNSQALAEALDKMLYDKNLRKRIGENAKKGFNQKYNIKKMRNDIKNLLSSVENISSSQKR